MRLVISLAWHPSSISARHLSLPHFCYHYCIRIILNSIITPTAWLTPSKLLANPLEAKLRKKRLQPRRLVRVPLLAAEPRSLMAIVLALFPSTKFRRTKNAQNFCFAKHHSALSEGTYTECQGRLAFSIFSIWGITGSIWGITCWTLWGFKLVHAKRATIMPKDIQLTWQIQRDHECW